MFSSSAASAANDRSSNPIAAALVLVVQFERKLNLSWSILLRAYNAERTIGVAAAELVRIAELNPVEGVENFGAKLQVESVIDRRRLEKSEVPVGYSLHAEIGIDARLIPKPILRWLSEASLVEPAADSGIS